MIICVGADHRGVALAELLSQWLIEESHTIYQAMQDRHSPEDDYVDYAAEVGRRVAEKDDVVGIVICGSGVGVCVAANKIPGVRCGLGFTQKQVQAARADDTINVLALASDFTDLKAAKILVTAFLETKYEPNERHDRRLRKLAALEKE